MATATDVATRQLLDILSEFGDQVMLTAGREELQAPWYERKPLSPEVMWTVTGNLFDRWHVCTADVVDDSGCVYWRQQLHLQLAPRDLLVVDLRGEWRA